MQIQSILVDDTTFHLEVLSDLLHENHPEIVVTGKAKNGTEALEKIQSLQPALVFLDVEMPDMTGFEVLASLDRIDFQTIFVTAHSQYAIQAIRFSALDYLMKPIDHKELAQAIKRFRSKGYVPHNQVQVQLALENLKKDNVQEQVLFLPTQEGGIKMMLQDIFKIEGDRNYSTFYLTDGKTKISSKTLGHFEEILNGKGFFRCHRSCIVNRFHIDKMKGDYFLLKQGEQVPISRRRKSEAKAWFYGI
jgi:two-component system LytT family response regulator